MRSLVPAMVDIRADAQRPRRPSSRLLGLVPALVVASGLITVWAGPLAAPAAAVAVPTGSVVAWGSDTQGQTTVPAGLSGVTSVAAGVGFSLALKSNGTVVAWGDNTYGQTAVPSGLSGVTAIAAGWFHALALESNGTVVAWGDNTYGQTSVPAGLSGVIAIAAGDEHSLALKSNGTVVAWGTGGSGQTAVPAGLSGVIAIAAGGFHSLALKSGGTVVAWGDDTDHQTEVPTSLSGVTAIAADGWYSLALKSGGTVVAWGDNSYGQTTVPSGLTGVTAIAAGEFHSLALKSNGTVVGWGSNGANQATVPSGLSGVTAIAAGGYHSLAVSGAAAGVVSGLALSGLPNPYPGGTAEKITVTARDAFGNTVTGYRGTVHFTSSDPKAVLPANYTFTSADAGVHVFSVTLKTFGATVRDGDRHRERPRSRGSQSGIVRAVARRQLLRHKPAPHPRHPRYGQERQPHQHRPLWSLQGRHGPALQRGRSQVRGRRNGSGRTGQRRGGERQPDRGG